MLIFRTSALKNPAQRSVRRSWHAAARSRAPDRRAPTRRHRTRAPPDPAAASSMRRLVGMDLVALRQVRHRRLLSQRLKRDLRLQRTIKLTSRSLRHRLLRLVRNSPELQSVLWSQKLGPLQVSLRMNQETGIGRVTVFHPSETDLSTRIFLSMVDFATRVRTFLGRLCSKTRSWRFMTIQFGLRIMRWRTFFEIQDLADTLVLFRKKNSVVNESLIYSIMRSLFDLN